jgi:FlaG/FlaF family flagellin (archaellin)
MKIAKLFSFLAVLILGCATAVCAASNTAPAKAKSTTTTSKSTTATKPAVHHIMGTVASVTDSDLVVEHEWKGKKEQTKFALDSNTKKEGDITKGCHVNVAYELQNHQRTATEVKVSAMKSEMKNTKTPKKS